MSVISPTLAPRLPANQEGQEPITPKSNPQYTLHAAVSMGLARLAREALGNGANPNAHQITLTPFAVIAFHIMDDKQKQGMETLRVLLEYGVDVNQPDAQGWTLAHHLCAHYDLSISHPVIDLIGAQLDWEKRDKEGRAPEELLATNSPAFGSELQSHLQSKIRAYHAFQCMAKSLPLKDEVLQARL